MMPRSLTIFIFCCRSFSSSFLCSVTVCRDVLSCAICWSRCGPIIHFYLLLFDKPSTRHKLRHFWQSTQQKFKQNWKNLIWTAKCIILMDKTTVPHHCLAPTYLSDKNTLVIALWWKNYATEIASNKATNLCYQLLPIELFLLLMTIWMLKIGSADSPHIGIPHCVECWDYFCVRPGRLWHWQTELMACHYLQWHLMWIIHIWPIYSLLK